MSANATERLGVMRAPASLEIIQDFVNTDAAGQTDLLADVVTAQQWFEPILARHTPEPGSASAVLNGHDLQRLTEMRVKLREALRRSESAGGVVPDWIAKSGVSVGLRQAGDGTVTVMPQGKGWRLVASLLLMQSLLAQRTALWPRLKICRNPVCGTAFYDRSRNNSGVWHDVLTCGNTINLRTSRARRRAAQAQPGNPPR